jgi:hypothetical protein
MQQLGVKTRRTSFVNGNRTRRHIRELYNNVQKIELLNIK